MRSVNFLKVVLVFLCASVSLFAQTPPQRDPIIAGITVEGVTEGIDMQSVISYSGLRVGMEARRDALTAAIKNLWTRRQFKNIRIDKERETPLGVFLVIRIEPAARLRRITFEGNDELSVQKLEKAAGKVRGDILSPYEEYEIRQGIKKAYEDEGMLFAKVTTKATLVDSANFTDVLVTIDEGAEYSVEAIEFEGNLRYSDDDLAGAFSDTKTKSWYEIWKSNKYDAKKYRDDIEKLKVWFASHGLLDAQVVRDTVIFHEDRSSVTIRVTVEEGPEVYIRNIKFVGNTVFEEEALKKRLNIVPGELYNEEKLGQNTKMNADQTDAASLYSDNGYLMATLKPDIVRVTSDSIDIMIRVAEGERFTIRRVDIIGNTKTRDRVVRRELYTRPGDYFNRSALIRSMRGLGVLNYFNQETLQPKVVPVDNTHVDVSYSVEERSTDTFNASVGFAGAFGLTGSVGVTLNNFDISQPLRGGGGQVMSFQWDFGQNSSIQTFQLSFTEPWLMGEPTSVGFNIYDTRRNLAPIITHETGGQINFGRRFRWPDDFFRGDWSLAISRTESQTSSAYYRQGVYVPITIGQTISRTSLDNIMFPTSGSRFVLTARAALGALGLGTVDYGKLGITFDMVNPLLSIDNYPRLVLFMGSEMGFVDGFQNDTTILPTELYYMGGNGLGGFSLTPLRGYRDNSLGPINGSGAPLGGRVQARFLAELRFALTLNPFPIYLLSFAEAGNVWESLRTADPFGLKRAAGVGMRIMLQPIGLVGFDMGYGFDTDPYTGKTSGWRFHFQFGR